MSVSVNGLAANMLNAAATFSIRQTMLIGAHIRLPTGISLGSINAWYGATSPSGNFRGIVNNGPTLFGRHNYTSGLQNAHTTTIANDAWVFVGHFLGPMDGSSHPQIVWTGDLKDSVSQGTTDLTEDTTQFRIGGEYEFGSNASTFRTGQIAEAFIFTGITEANADSIVTEAQDTLPSAFSTATPDHYWPLSADGTASIGGANLTSGGSPTFNAGVHPELSSGGGGGSSAQPVVVII